MAAAIVVVFGAIYFLNLPVAEVADVRRGTAISAIYGTVRIEPTLLIPVRAQNAGFIQLADALSRRFAPSEVCELARSPNVVVRALAQESLAQSPTATLVELLGDPIDSDIARDALERQATEYGSEIARQLINALEQTDIVEDEV